MMLHSFLSLEVTISPGPALKLPYKVFSLCISVAVNEITYLCIYHVLNCFKINFEILSILIPFVLRAERTFFCKFREINVFGNKAFLYFKNIPNIDSGGKIDISINY